VHEELWQHAQHARGVQVTPFLSFPFLSFPFLSFPFLSFPVSLDQSSPKSSGIRALPAAKAPPPLRRPELLRGGLRGDKRCGLPLQLICVLRGSALSIEKVEPGCP